MQKYRTMKSLLGSNNIEVISRYETAMRHIFLQKSKNSELILDGEEAVLSWLIIGLIFFQKSSVAVYALN